MNLDGSAPDAKIRISDIHQSHSSPNFALIHDILRLDIVILPVRERSMSPGSTHCLLLV